MQDSELLTHNSQLSTPKTAFLWDESFLWGIMAYKALKSLDLPFDLIRAEDIKDGVLRNYKMLFVPGGWASNKSTALCEDGIKAIRDFVEKGGNYLGFCGGAGLATKAKGCIGLLDIKRRPTSERVPSFSGRIHLNVNEHEIWEGITTSISDQRSAVNRTLTPVFHAWWPSQFIIEDNKVKVLATYGDALPDAFSSDLNVGDVQLNGNWDELENIYGINLNPARLKNEPCVLEGNFGKGKVVLSLIHFDTPGDDNGQRVLVNLWEYLNSAEVRKCRSAEGKAADTSGLPSFRASGLFALCSDLISLGERNFLWFWRNPMLLQWRRGVRGLEYNTLYIMMKEIAEHGGRGELQYAPAIGNMEALLVPFIEKAKRLLILERHVMQKGHITYERCDDPEIQSIREELFSKSKSYGGRFKELLDVMDRHLFELLCIEHQKRS